MFQGYLFCCVAVIRRKSCPHDGTFMPDRDKDDRLVEIPPIVVSHHADNGLTLQEEPHLKCNEHMQHVNGFLRMHRQLPKCACCQSCAFMFHDKAMFLPIMTPAR